MQGEKKKIEQAVIDARYEILQNTKEKVKRELKEKVEFILTHTEDERFEHTVNICKKELEKNERSIKQKKQTGYYKETGQEEFKKDLHDLEIERIKFNQLFSRKKYILQDFAEDKERLLSMSDEEFIAELERRALFEAKQKLSSEGRKFTVDNDFKAIYNGSNEETKKAIDTVFGMANMQVEKNNEHKNGLKDSLIWAGEISAMNTACFGFLGGINNALSDVDGKIAPLNEIADGIGKGALFGLIAGLGIGVVTSAATSAINSTRLALGYKKLLKKYPMAVERLKTLDIYDLVIERLKYNENYSYDDTLLEEAIKELEKIEKEEKSKDKAKLLVP